eukprot:TRINITY_DN530_c0_g1_i2.p1 TRINITY_DN530_c0_g1~~TRINITY_DN530_c0_g1_i2.p1  ORF type:complete len:1209 (+),score=181.06 TRINITY_DN530_c0_g1_i2:477-4103(+)
MHPNVAAVRIQSVYRGYYVRSHKDAVLGRALQSLRIPERNETLTIQERDRLMAILKQCAVARQDWRAAAVAQRCRERDWDEQKEAIKKRDEDWNAQCELRQKLWDEEQRVYETADINFENAQRRQRGEPALTENEARRRVETRKAKWREELEAAEIAVRKDKEELKRRATLAAADVLQQLQQRAQIKPPTGEVAFVFTDIQNSTVLWNKIPNPMRVALKLHNDCLRASLRAHRGYEVKTEGDAFVVAFATAKDALLFCCESQMNLLQCPWPRELLEFGHGEIWNSKKLLWNGLRVRMGIHLGRPLCEQDPTTLRMDYLGPVVNRAARVSALACGGQVLMSKEVRRALDTLAMYDDELSDILASKVVVQSIGARLLKGFEKTKEDELFCVLPLSLKDRQYTDETAELPSEDTATSSVQPRSPEADALTRDKSILSSPPPTMRREDDTPSPSSRQELRYEASVSGLSEEELPRQLTDTSGSGTTPRFEGQPLKRNVQRTENHISEHWLDADLLKVALQTNARGVQTETELWHVGCQTEVAYAPHLVDVSTQVKPKAKDAAFQANSSCASTAAQTNENADPDHVALPASPLTPAGFAAERFWGVHDDPKSTNTAATVPPVGQVVLVCIAVENAGELWKYSYRDMERAVSEYLSCVRVMLARYRGYEARTEGDVCLLAFRRITEAVRFCISVQQELLRRTWPAGLTTHQSVAPVMRAFNCRYPSDQAGDAGTQYVFRGLRIRMGVHSGHVQSTPGATQLQYHGRVVEETVAIVSNAHGGEVLVSPAAQAAMTAHKGFQEALRTHFLVLREIPNSRMKPVSPHCPTLYRISLSGLSERDFHFQIAHDELDDVELEFEWDGEDDGSITPTSSNISSPSSKLRKASSVESKVVGAMRERWEAERYQWEGRIKQLQKEKDTEARFLAEERARAAQERRRLVEEHDNHVLELQIRHDEQLTKRQTESTRRMEELQRQLRELEVEKRWLERKVESERARLESEEDQRKQRGEAVLLDKARIEAEEQRGRGFLEGLQWTQLSALLKMEHLQRPVAGARRLALKKELELLERKRRSNFITEEREVRDSIRRKMLEEHKLVMMNESRPAAGQSRLQKIRQSPAMQRYLDSQRRTPQSNSILEYSPVRLDSRDLRSPAGPRLTPSGFVLESQSRNSPSRQSLPLISRSPTPLGSSGYLKTAASLQNFPEDLFVPGVLDDEEG